MYVCCPNGPFGYCQTVSPFGALTTAAGLPIRASTSLIDEPGWIDGPAAQPTSARRTASHELLKRSGGFIARLLLSDASPARDRVPSTTRSAPGPASGAPVARLVELVH